jgi:drug/metabolite transporter (DMT)-like permease
MVTMLALVAATLYGTADFLGGAASRRAHPLAVLAITAPAGAVVMLAAAVATRANITSLGWVHAGWAATGGAAGALGLIAFYRGFAAAPMSVVAPVTALIATVLPVGVALSQGERPNAGVACGAVICIAAVILISAERPSTSRPRLSERLRALEYAVPAGVAFGLFFLFLRNGGTTAVVWPVTVARVAGTAVALACCGVLRVGPLSWRGQRGTFGTALVSGAIDAGANVCYVLATQAGLFGLAVVVTSLYPGITVLLARYVFGERMRWVQRAGLILAGVGVALVTL